MASTISGSAIIPHLRSINASSFDSERERRQVLREAYSLVSRLETPMETSNRLCTVGPVSSVCIKIALDLNLFQAWSTENNGRPCSMKELQELVPQCDHILLVRILRHLVSADFLLIQSHDSDEPLYEMTPFIHGLIKNDVASQTEIMFRWAMPMIMSLPRYFEKIQYINPQDASVTADKDFTGGISMWEYLQANSDWAHLFGRLMKASSTWRGDITTHLEDLQLTCDRDDSVLLVDVGGSVGHDLKSFRQRFKEARGRLILQDLPHVIESVPSLTSQGIETMSYDFFTPQPVKGAKGYLLHHILHDWSDREAMIILKTLAVAMERSYSRLLICEMVIQEKSPTMRETSFDWYMILYGNGMERTEEQWRRLIDSAGLRIRNIKRSAIDSECLIEVEKV